MKRELYADEANCLRREEYPPIHKDQATIYTTHIPCLAWDSRGYAEELQQGVG